MPMSKVNNILDNIKIVLCNTSHSGNIGSSARAMKTMGLHNLILVNPTAIIDDHAIALACNAFDVLQDAKIVHAIDDAIGDTTLSIALSSRKREFTNNLTTPKKIMAEIFTHIRAGGKTALVFGSEKNGLTIEQLEKCNCIVTIPGNIEYCSLNLSQAVQIMCYEIYNNYTDDCITHLYNDNNLATLNATTGVLAHIEQILYKINFFKNKSPTRTKRHLQNIMHKMRLEHSEIDIVRGVLRQIENHFK